MEEVSYLEQIDFQSVLEQIARNAFSSRGAEIIRKARPRRDLKEIQNEQNLAREAMAFEQAGAYVSLGGLSDIRNAVKSASKGICLLPAELLDIANFLAACQSVSNAFSSELYPLLADIASTVSPCKSLMDQINRCIDLSGTIRSNATPQLESLERKLQQAKADLSAAGKRFAKANENSLMETITTTIQGRLCVLVKASEKNRFGGMIHGSSQSGMAFYMEPAALVGLNNEVQSVQLEIEEEKKKICRELSSLVRSQAGRLRSNEESLVVLDVALAKGKWAVMHDGCIPSIQTKDHSLLIEHAIHPLLKRETAVANTYALKPEQRCLMISGANMGGKTVTLKTIGLFIALAHAGFPVGAHRAVLPFFKELYFDIGDSQSIENSLSTFSGHVFQLSKILRKADKNAFVLLDEIGNGTDPQEGAALAQAVLEELIARGCLVITSTHYDSVKAFGKTCPSVLVSSVEFDPATLKPTYRYLPGVSGASYAFHIASQFQLDRSVIERARDLKRENETDVQKQLAALEIQQQKVQKDRDRFEKLVANAHNLQKQAAEEKKKIEKQKKRFDEEYEQLLQDYLFEKKEEARAILRDLRQSQQAGHEQIEQLGRLSALAQGTEDNSSQPDTKTYSFKEGDYVHIETLNNHGEIQSISKNKAQVLVNGRKVRVGLDQLTPMKKPKVVKSPKKAHTDRSFKAFPLELNIIGCRVEEGIQALDHYLDQAVYHRIKNVRIIHGMGTGALRAAVWDDLKKQSCVKHYAAGGPSEGGLGATVVELK